ncbi:hypothetical protein BDW74DRAFT_172872 [Aspergillus multicolor]|uniref:uncharacterized protein n=1 Tax=Aspergillus multicolor TaxID=41759 RepID=UPI003CCDF1BD
MRENPILPEANTIPSAPETPLLAVVIRKQRSSSAFAQSEGQDTRGKRPCNKHLGSASESSESEHSSETCTPLRERTLTPELGQFQTAAMGIESEVSQPATPPSAIPYGFNSIDKQTPPTTSPWHGDGDVDFDGSDDNSPSLIHSSDEEPMNATGSATLLSSVASPTPLYGAAHLDISEPDGSDSAWERSKNPFAERLAELLMPRHPLQKNGLQRNDSIKRSFQMETEPSPQKKETADLAKEVDIERKSKDVLEQKVLSLERELQ